MRRALAQAERADRRGEVPVGAVLVDGAGRLLAESHNQPVSARDPTAHAEVMVLRAAARAVDNYRLVDTTLYVTLEPCPMCVGALVHARVARLVYGATEPRTGAIESAGRLFEHMVFNHSIEIEGGVLADEASTLLREFFVRRRAEQREQKKNPPEETS